MIRALILLCLFSSATISMAAMLRVPLDHPDVNAALAVAQEGDTVAVAASFSVPGGLQVPGRELALLGGWNDEFTMMTGSSPVNGTTSAPAIHLLSPDTGSPLVGGFTVTGGVGLELSNPIPGRYGGGILVEGGSPTLQDLTLTGGIAGGNNDFGGGGGLALIGTEALVQRVTVTGCRASWGAGILIVGGAAVMQDCMLIDNTCFPLSGGQVASGAGLAIYRGNLVLEDTEIRGGRGAARGGGLAWLGVRGRVLEVQRCLFLDNTMELDGGGLFAENGTVTLEDCRFEDNIPAPDAPYTSGGGAYITGAGATLVGVVFAQNQANAGGGLTVNTAPQADVQDCVFLANESDFFGAALNYQSNDTGEVSGNTVAGNMGVAETGVVNLVNFSSTLSRNLVAWNAGGGVALSSGTLMPTCNNVFGNSGSPWIGLADPTGSDGNFSVDPFFCDLEAGDLSLRNDSPCLDAPGCGLVGALGEGCGGGVSVGDTPSSLPPVVAFPNPFNPRVTLRAHLDGGPVRLSIHDVRGRLVRVLVEADRPAGTLEAVWDGRDARGRGMSSGVYSYRLETVRGVATGRLTLLR